MTSVLSAVLLPEARLTLHGGGHDVRDRLGRFRGRI